MKFVAAVLTLAAVATAAPAEVVARTAGSCNVNGNTEGKMMCCDSGIPILGELLCNIAVLGGNCNVGQSTYCCNSQSQGGLINVDVSCLKL
ncbi:hypothetical protein MHUMG1_09745 [Metarhizium humberi]|uniref:Hydrophobin n=1 Tax=Metarhizium humberi TaxID=2596975 RepID=A0A9P8S3N8_9HYPO|nr:hypothetical protein MHUMG1_09745 [Metarhizium humberi]